MGIDYHHIQRVPDKVMAAAGLAGFALGLTPPGFLLRLALLGTLGTAAVTFRCLTVEVDDRNVRIRFGDGLIKRTFPLTDIASARAIRTTPMQGWGIHWLGNGWIYNVYGLDAVELSFKDGKRAVVGTDDPQGLTDAVLERLDQMEQEVTPS